MFSRTLVRLSLCVAVAVSFSPLVLGRAGGEAEKIKTELGEYECEHFKGETEVEGPMDQKIKFGGELWTNEKVPFGLVKAKVKADIGVGNIDTEMVAIKSGKDAKSELPDAK